MEKLFLFNYLLTIYKYWLNFDIQIRSAEDMIYEEGKYNYLLEIKGKVKCYSTVTA